MELEKVEIGEIKTLEEAVTLIKLLVKEVLILRAENAKLKEKVSELSKNSNTSSKPPSSDITKPPVATKSEDGKPLKNKRGGQNKHAGVSRTKFPFEKIDRVVEIKLESSECAMCGGKLSEHHSIQVNKTQIAEFVSKPVEVVEYHQHGKYCVKCKKVEYPKLPDGAGTGSLFDRRLQALVGYLKAAIGCSYTDIANFCEEVLGIKVSNGMLCNVVSSVSDALEKPYVELGNHIKSERCLNIDETGWRDSGKRHWVWLFCTNILAYFVVSPSRGAKVLYQVLGDTFSGAIISDFYGAYVCYANELQQFCLAHLIRDIKFLTTLPDQISKDFGNKLLDYFRALFTLWHSRKKIPYEQFVDGMKSLEDEIYAYLAQIHLEKGKAFTLRKRFVKHRDSIFRFTNLAYDLEPTNNLAERITRHVVLIRKISLGSWSNWGQRWVERSSSIVASLRNQHRSPFDFILSSIIAHQDNTPHPSLIPTITLPVIAQT